MARIVLVIQPTSNGVSLTWSDGPASFSSYELPLKSLAIAAETARKTLGAVVECFFSGEPADVSAASAALAASGFGLYQALFKASAEQQTQVSEIRKWLDKLQAQDAIETLEVVAEGVEPVPWNLVYDRKPDPAAFQTGGTDPGRWRPFWGLRYELAGGRRVSPLRRFPVLQNPRVVVVTDPMVIDNLPAESRELTALCRDNNWPVARSRTELAEVMKAGRPDILYWLGHTQTDPFGLVLGEDAISPDELRTLMEGDSFGDTAEVFGGIAFLNACGTATGDKSESFLEALHPLGLSGYIVTEQSTIDTFAAPLGREFLSGFVLRGEPLGQVMRRLRGEVPLGLLYGAYCPPLIQVRRAGQTSITPESSVPVILTSPATGNKLGRSAGTTAAVPYPLPPLPYRSLRSYGVGDRALFAGREDDVLRFAQLLDEPGTRLLILHGESGVGKTSFLRAGLMPYLEHDCVGYRFARDRTTAEGDSILLVRATNDLISQIAAALTSYCSRPLVFSTPQGAENKADLSCVLQTALGGREGHEILRDALRADPSLLSHLLVDLARKLPFTPVLVIDQAEEVFTLARTPADELNRTQALEMLRRAATGPAGFKIVVSLRTEYHGRLADRLRKGIRDSGGVRDYLLTDFGVEALIEVIRRPTSPSPIEHASEVPFEKYKFRYAEGVAEEIARRARAYTINSQDSVLPLIQVICTQLYDRAKTSLDGVIALAELDAIGGVEGGMRAHAEGLLRRLFPQRGDQKAFQRLVSNPETQLFLSQSDGTLTTALLPAEYLAEYWSGRMPFEEVLRAAGDGDWRLIRVNSLRIGSDEHERTYVSLGHDALAKVLAGWQEEGRRRAHIRKYAVAVISLALVVGALSFLTAWALEQRQSARSAATEAENQREIANSNSAAALVAKDAAERAGAAELIATKNAEVAKATAIEERGRAELREYFATVRCAGLEWELGHYGESIRLLARFYKKALEEGTGRYFGFEWHYQWRRLGIAYPPLRGHTRSVTSASFSKDGRRVVTSSWDGTAKVWDAQTGDALLTLDAHIKNDRIMDASFSPDGHQVATANWFGAARIWDLATGQIVHTLKGHQTSGKDAERNMDDDDERSRQNQELWRRKGGNRSVTSVSYSPDGSLVATTGCDKTAKVWDAKTGNMLHNLKGHGDVVSSAAFSGDGTRLVTGSWDGSAKLWDIRTGAAIKTFDGPRLSKGVTSVALSPDGSALATGTFDELVTVWWIAAEKRWDVPGNPGHAVSFFPDSVRIATTSFNKKSTKIFRLERGEDLKEFQAHLGHANSVSVSTDGERLVISSLDQSALIFDLKSEAPNRLIKTDTVRLRTAIFSPDGIHILTASLDGKSKILDASTGEQRVVFNHGAEVDSASYSPDGSRVVTSGGDKKAIVWEAATGRELKTLHGHTKAVIAASFNPDGTQVVTGSKDHQSIIWDLERGSHRLLGATEDERHTGFVRSAAFSNDGKFIVTASMDQTAKIWDAKTAALIRNLEGHKDAVLSASFSPDGKWVVTSSWDGNAIIWDAWTGNIIHILPGDARALHSAAFSPAGDRIVTGGQDGTTNVWDARSGAILLTLVKTGPDGVINSASFGPDGRKIIIAKNNGNIVIWNGSSVFR